MLRVRGDSMIDAGILDGDYVVVRHQEDAENGDVVVAGIPDEEATVKVFARKRGKIVLTPANATHAADDLRARPGVDLRQGADRPAPALRPARPRGARRGPLGPPRATRRSTCSSAWWASSGSPGPKLVAGTPWAANVATSVQPSLARGGRPDASSRRASTG